ncbi:hypothetical protein FQA39_LY10055 [Lamprigera yunnana]|nr:hypothetical protein FQA39_LY10055 [Lamprigera yunnana]
MCILFIYTEPNPPKGGYRLILATNRDEYYKRQAECAFHCTETNIIGGRDMEYGKEGGMWMGVSLNKIFRLGCLLNVTGEPHADNVEGRGSIVLNYLEEVVRSEDYIEILNKRSFNAFNLVTVELSDNNAVVYHHSNAPQSSSKYEGRQILGFGNSTVETPLQKVIEGKKKFTQILDLSSEKSMLITKLTELLKDKKRYLPDAELQRRTAAYEHLSSIYVETGVGYGTR